MLLSPSRLEFEFALPKVSGSGIEQSKKVFQSAYPNRTTDLIA